MNETAALTALLRAAGATDDQFEAGGPDGQDLVDLITATAPVWAAFRSDLAEEVDVTVTYLLVPAPDFADGAPAWSLQPGAPLPLTLPRALDAVRDFCRAEDGRFFQLEFSAIGGDTWEVSIFLGRDFTHPEARTYGVDDRWLTTSGPSPLVAARAAVEKLPAVTSEEPS